MSQWGDDREIENMTVCAHVAPGAFGEIKPPSLVDSLHSGVGQLKPDLMDLLCKEVAPALLGSFVSITTRISHE